MKHLSANLFVFLIFIPAAIVILALTVAMSLFAAGCAVKEFCFGIVDNIETSK